MMLIKKSVCVLVVGILSGCSTVSLDKSFEDVSTLVHDRAQTKIVWAKDKASEDEVSKRVSTLLLEPLTPEKAAEIALLNNKRVQATYEELGIQRAELLQAGLLRNPIFEVRPRFASGGGGTNLELGLSQSLFETFFIPLRQRIATSRLEVVKATVASELINVATDTKKAYFELQGALQTLDVAKRVLENADASFETTKSLHAAGNTSVLNFQIDNAQYEEAKSALIDAESDVYEKDETLRALLGIGGVSELKIAPKLSVPPKDTLDRKSLEEKVLDQSLELKVAKLEVDAVGAELGLQSSYLLSNGEIGVSSERDLDGTWVTGPNLLIPLPIFDQGQAFSEGASARLRRAEGLYNALLNQKRSELRAVLKKMESSMRKATLYERTILPLRASITNETQTNYNAMLDGVFDLLNAKKTEIQAALGYIEALKTYWTERAELQKLLGVNLQNSEGN